MTPGAVLTIAFGVWLWLGWFRGARAGCTRRSRWSRCSSVITSGAGELLRDFAAERNAGATSGSRWFNEIPDGAVLFATVFLVVFKPF